MKKVDFKKNSEVCINNIKVITIAQKGYYLSIENTILQRTLDIIENEEKNSYNLLGYNIIKAYDSPNIPNQEYISQIILKKNEN